ncbi:MAG: TatD family hydrolase [Candidatus Xenobiia bacterium LiM19]
MIDVHAHLTSADFTDDIEDVITRATDAGVKAVLVAGENYDDNKKVLELCAVHPLLRPCLGHYPSVPDRTAAFATIDLIRSHRQKIAAISEVGLDFRIAEDSSARDIQIEIFSLFIDLSRELSLPLVVHSRSAGHHAIELLASKGAEKVCMHAFDGKAGYAQIGVQRGYYFSIPPSVVRSPQKIKLVVSLPIERILLETDSPVLGRSAEERNEPAFLIHAAEEIARLKGLELSHVLKVTEENTRRLFGEMGTDSIF